MKTETSANSKYSIFDRIIEGVQIINQDWQYVYVNDTVAAQGKSAKEELLGHTMMEKYPGIEKTEMFRFLEKCMREEKPHQMVNEFNFLDGSKGYFELRMQPIEEGVLILSFDVTRQKLLEEELQRTNIVLEEKVKERTHELTVKNKELEQFTYIASHDLKEPLRTVSNYIQVLKEDCGNKLDDTASGYLDAISRSTDRMQTLIKAMLDYSRLGRDRKLIPVDCSLLIKDVLADLKGIISSSGAAVKVGKMPLLNAYEIEMRQLFQNLISNAVKFSRKEVKPQIRVQSEPAENGWRFTVEDNGIGIDSFYNDRIFNIFYRLNQPGEYEGSGIGLANCKKIVELHRGEISVESRPGEGSKFTFVIPTL